MLLVGNDMYYISLKVILCVVSSNIVCSLNMRLRLQLVRLVGNVFQQATLENEVPIVNASFHVTHWSVSPFGTGLSRVKYVGK